jgi:GGDEF domain-containing protein
MFKLTNNNLSSKTINQYRTDHAYGCYTRNCLELEIWPAVAASVKYVVFADLDQMHKANERYGYASVDKRIRTAINTGREMDIAVARWYSGDELVFIVPEGPRSGNPIAFCERIQSRLQKQGLSATFGVVEIRGYETKNPKRAVNRAARLVQKAKKNGLRAIIQAEKRLNPASTPTTIQPVSLSILLGRLAAFLTALIY